MEQIELSKNLARVQELAKALRITPLFERLVDLKKEGLLVNPKFSFEELVIDLLENVKASRENKKVNTLLKTMDIHHPTACINSIRWDVDRQAGTVVVRIHSVKEYGEDYEMHTRYKSDGTVEIEDSRK